MDPYEILGVDRQAEPDAIRRAYRNLSKKHHPDAGGDPDKFMVLLQAYQTLSDPEKRAHFDATGEVDSAPSEEEKTQKRAMIFLNELLTELVLGKRFTPYDDLRKIALEIIDAKLEEVDAFISGLRVKEKKIRQVVKRWRRKTANAPDFIAGTLNMHLEQVRLQIRATRGDRKVVEKVREIITDYEFKPAKPKQQPVHVRPASRISGVQLFWG